MALVLTMCALLAAAILLRVAFAYGVMKGARSMARLIVSVGPATDVVTGKNPIAGRTDTGTGTTVHRDERVVAVPAQERRSPGTNTADRTKT